MRYCEAKWPCGKIDSPRPAPRFFASKRTQKNSQFAFKTYNVFIFIIILKNEHELIFF
jgi:hypothetical protein